MRILRQNQFHDKLQVNSKLKSQTQHDSKILYCQFTQLTYPYAFKFAILKHVINIFFEILFDFCFSQKVKQKIQYHCQKSMVFRITIAIDGMVPAQPLVPMVFQWFFRFQPLVSMVFQWFFPIQPLPLNEWFCGSPLTSMVYKWSFAFTYFQVGQPSISCFKLLIKS